MSYKIGVKIKKLGRKSLDANKSRIAKTISLDQATLNGIEEVGEGNLSKGVRKLFSNHKTGAGGETHRLLLVALNTVLTQFKSICDDLRQGRQGAYMTAIFLSGKLELLIQTLDSPDYFLEKLDPLDYRIFLELIGKSKSPERVVDSFLEKESNHH